MWKRLVLSDYVVLWLCVAYFLVMSLLVPGWVTRGSLLTILSSMLPLLIVAVGQTMVMILGGIDLSITAVIAMASVVGAMVMGGEVGLLAGASMATPAGVLVMLAVGTGIGLLNGLSVVLFRMPSLLVTLSTMLLFSGGAIWLTVARTGASSIARLPDAFTAIGREWNGITVYGVMMTALVALVAHVVLARTVYGQWLYAVGLNRVVARISGVPVRRTEAGVFVASGFFAAVAAILLTARMETGSPTLWPTIRLLDVIGAVVIGGTSLYGGRGRIGGTVLGVLFIVQVDQSLSMLGLSDATSRMAKGGLILLAATLDSTRVRLQLRQ